MTNYLKILLLSLLIPLLTACGFHLQRTPPLAMPLHRLYLQTPDPYGTLAQSLQQLLLAANVTLVNNPSQATTILHIEQNNQSEILLSVNATQQTRQYNLHTVVLFSVTNAQGQEIVPTQAATEDKPITIQASQVLGGSNQVDSYYEQMQRNIAVDILNRLASTDVSVMLTK